MKISILTLFPEFFKEITLHSILGRAVESKKLEVEILSLRDFGEGKYKAVDDRPYGGGPGMLFMPEVLEKAFLKLMHAPEALLELEQSVQVYRQQGIADVQLPFVVYLSPQGKTLTAQAARAFAGYSHLILLCGHYEGVDERVLDAFVHAEVSIGDYVLTGGEPAAWVVMDAICRFIPGVLGDEMSAKSDTFEASTADMVAGGLKSPQFTRPQTWRNRAVPSVLLSGDHGAIQKWRATQSLERTQQRRPDLLEKIKK